MVDTFFEVPCVNEKDCFPHFLDEHIAMKSLGQEDSRPEQLGALRHWCPRPWLFLLLWEPSYRKKSELPDSDINVAQFVPYPGHK